MGAVLELGPMWVKETRAGMQRRRESLARSAAHCKRDGAFREQLEMVVRELDAMLAGSDLLTALQYFMQCIDNSAHMDNLRGGVMGSGFDMAYAAIAKATGGAE